jgi:hypothetical protein
MSKAREQGGKLDGNHRDAHHRGLAILLLFCCVFERKQRAPLKLSVRRHVTLLRTEEMRHAHLRTVWIYLLVHRITSPTFDENTNDGVIVSC